MERTRDYEKGVRDKDWEGDIVKVSDRIKTERISKHGEIMTDGENDKGKNNRGMDECRDGGMADAWVDYGMDRRLGRGRRDV